MNHPWWELRTDSPWFPKNLKTSRGFRHKSLTCPAQMWWMQLSFVGMLALYWSPWAILPRQPPSGMQSLLQHRQKTTRQRKQRLLSEALLIDLSSLELLWCYSRCPPQQLGRQWTCFVHDWDTPDLDFFLGISPQPTTPTSPTVSSMVLLLSAIVLLIVWIQRIHGTLEPSVNCRIYAMLL